MGKETARVGKEQAENDIYQNKKKDIQSQGGFFGNHFHHKCRFVNPIPDRGVYVFETHRKIRNVGRRDKQGQGKEKAKKTVTSLEQTAWKPVKQ
ncbi:hypothetical protein FACS1894123_02550 [Bacteroidia bacterium]|nr:hypothetical protein FACS1894123_02550 [Bacteroidia bacterium]